MPQFNVSNLFTFAKSLEGQELPTIGGKSKFILSAVTNDHFYYNVSTNKERRQAKKYIERIIQRYLITNGSFGTTEYSDITVNASYILTIIKMFLQNNRMLI